jgi:Flp pilus assembly protein TadD
MLNWFDTNQASELGTALADGFASTLPPEGNRPVKGTAEGIDDSSLARLLRRAEEDVKFLRMNFYKKAKLANSFKWRLIEHGIDAGVADQVTQCLVMHLSHIVGDSRQKDTANSAISPKANVATINELLTQGNKSFEHGNYPEAVRLYEELVAIAPRRADVLNILGVALCRMHRYQEGEQRYREAIELDPGCADALSNLASVLQGNPQEAEHWLRRTLKVNPKYPGARSRLGTALAFAGRQHEAKAAFRKALKLDPRDTDAIMGMARIARAEGRFDDAESLIKRALLVKPRLPTAWAALDSIRKMTSVDGEWLKVAEEIAASGISLWEEAEVRFAIGKHYDDVNDFDNAFSNYRRGNELLKSVADPYDRQSHARFADDMIRSHTRERLSSIGGSGSDSQKPIFVLGMPRSGTSLLEQIIASHPAVKGAGEPDFWLGAARRHQEQIRSGLVDGPERSALAQEYLKVLEELCPGAHRIVDKTPTNSDYAGFIHSVFPRAQIIHMRRDPLDTCLSCYFQQFSTAMRFTMDLSDLADYYRTHERLMRHWAGVLPTGTMLEVPYEGLVSDQAGWTRKILEFLGLEWDERCLSFHETKRVVNTASAWQVRQKLYSQSVGRWRNYEKFLGSLKGLRDGQYS